MDDRLAAPLLLLACSALLLGVVAALLRRPSGGWRAPAVFALFLAAIALERLVLPGLVLRQAGHVARRAFGVRLWSHQPADVLHLFAAWQPATEGGPAAWFAAAALGAGLGLLAWAAWTLARAGRAGVLATTGPYARLRHPQHVAYMLMALGLLVFWPGWLAMATFPLLVALLWGYGRDEDAMLAQHWGDTWRRWAARTAMKGNAHLKNDAMDERAWDSAVRAKRIGEP